MGDRLLAMILGLSVLVACEKPTATSVVTPRATAPRQSRHQAAERLKGARELSADDARRLIRDFALPENQRAFPMAWGLLTAHVPEVDVLLAHPDVAYVPLLVALDDEDMHVRRYAAFSLGELRRADSVAHFQRAIAKEISRAANAPDKDHPALNAMIRAHARVGPRALVEWLQAPNFSAAEQPIVNRQLNWLLPRGPSCLNVDPMRCRHEWNVYWRSNEHLSNSYLFFQ